MKPLYYFTAILIVIVVWSHRDRTESVDRFSEPEKEVAPVVDATPPTAVLPEEVAEEIAAIIDDFRFEDGCAWNGRQGFSARYAVEYGMRIKGERWDVRMRLSTAGEEEPVTEGDTLRLAHGGGVEERWANGPAGVEHAVLLASRESAERAEDGRARVSFQVLTPLATTIADDGRSVEFRDVAGDVTFGYRDLRAIDARGQTLPSEFELVEESDGAWELAMLADDAEARYPLTIDPLMSTAERSFLLVEDPPQENALAGYSVAMSGEVIVVGVPRLAAGGSDGAAVIFRLDSENRWIREATLTPSNPVVGEAFGTSVDVYGSRVVVGAPTNVGRAFVFDYDPVAAAWSEGVELLPAPDEEVQEVLAFGLSVAVEGDQVFVGAPASNVGASNSAGVVQIFSLGGGGWEHVRMVIAPSIQAGANFGWALSSSGRRLAVGAPRGTPQAGLPESGVAYVIGYNLESFVGLSSRVVSAPNDQTGANFGGSVSLDGDTLVIGSPRYDWLGADSQGAIDVFEFDAESTQWDWETLLIAPDGSELDCFGAAVAISGDTIVVGAPDADVGSSDNGALFIFERYAFGASPGMSQWGFAEKKNGGNSNYGFSVAASADRFVAGVPTGSLSGQSQSGLVVTYAKRSSRWRENRRSFISSVTSVAIDRGYIAFGLLDYGGGSGTRVLVGSRNDFGAQEVWGGEFGLEYVPPPEAQVGQEFGATVALHEPWMLVGAPGWDEPGAEDSGRCYLFLHTPGAADEWTFIHAYGLPAAQAGARFGSSLAIGDRWFAAGAPGGDGAVLVYDRLRPSIGISWGLTQEIAGDGNAFGVAVALHPAGNLLAVGAPENGGGRTFIYELDSTNASSPWGFVRSIGYTVVVGTELRSGSSLAFRGDLLVVGEPGWSGGGRLAVREWNRGSDGEDHNWGLRWSVQIPRANDDAEFGASVAMSDRFIVGGAPGWAEGETRCGATFIFDPALENLTGTDVAPQDKFLPLDASDGGRGGACVAVDGTEIVSINPTSNYAQVLHRQWWAWTPRGFGTFGAAGYQNGYAVDIEGDYAAYSIPFDQVDGLAGAGSVRIYKRNSSGAGGWGIVKALYSPASAVGGNFGRSLGFSGNAIVVGAPGEDGGEGVGYLFERNFGGADNWGMSRRLAPNGLAPGDDFGEAVGIDGDVIAVGAPGRALNSGSVYLYGNKIGESKRWVFNTELQSPLGLANDFFGSAIAVEGHRVLVGSPLADFNVSGSGAAHLYGRGGFTDPETEWGLVRTLLGANQESGSLFGFSVALDGAVAVVGAPRQTVEPALHAGFAHVFLRDQNAPNAWGHARNLLPSFGENYPQAEVSFGSAVAVRGRRIAVSAPLTGRGALGGVGAVHVYDTNGFGSDDWGEVSMLMAEDSSAGDQIGQSLAIGPDTLVVGVPLWDRLSPLEADRGRVLLFSETGSGYEQWLSANFSPVVLGNFLQEEDVWGPLADPDGDGFTNLEEAYLDSDPNDPTSGDLGVVLEFENGEIYVRWHEGKESNGTIAHVSYSTDLQSWHLRDSGDYPLRTVGEGVGFLRREAILTDSADGGDRLFARIVIGLR